MQYFTFIKSFIYVFSTLWGRFPHFHVKDQPTEFQKAIDLPAAYKCWFYKCEVWSAIIMLTQLNHHHQKAVLRVLLAIR